MTYKTISPPFTLSLREMSKSELKRYFEWFMEVLPQRVTELAEAVKQTPGFEAWQPNNTANSLDVLGAWFADQVETRPRTREELQNIQGSQMFSVVVQNEELTTRTFSLAMDIGFYLSQVLLKNHPSLKWEQPFGSKRFVDYGQPSLGSFGLVTLNPVGIIVTLAYGLASKARTGRGLRDIYDIWAKKAESAVESSQ